MGPDVRNEESQGAVVHRPSKTLIIAAAVAGAVAVSGGIAAATGGDDNPPITGSELDRASAAAVEYTGGGRVTGTEAGDDEARNAGGWYEVEVTLDDGAQIDVRLDRQFNVVGSKADHETEDDGQDDSGT